MKYNSLLVLAAAFIFMIQPAVAQDVWNIDVSHSSVAFRVKHLMISNVRGDFGEFSGQILFDGKDYSTLKADVTIQAASINTREAKRDEHLRSDDFFDTATHPTITFKSKQVKGVDDRRFSLVGDLTMRGVTKEVVLDVEATPVIKGMRGETRVGASATTRINRQDYGVKYNRVLDTGGVVVGNEIQITIDLELVREN
jgi:polyisoprenoid-binding protein YceI